LGYPHIPARANTIQEKSMVQTMSDEAVERATGKPFAYWAGWLEEHGAGSRSHKEIAAMLHAEGGVPGWWSQMLTVAYEQHIGRRAPGQDCEGAYSVSVSRTLNGSLDGALDRWGALVSGMTSFSDIPVTRGPEISETPNWRYWRAGLADGSRVNVNISRKGEGKASLSIQHERLESAEQVEHWRAYWKQLLSGAG
jgi:hypothetical protein